jgi:hypothetical protein
MQLFSFISNAFVKDPHFVTAALAGVGVQPLFLTGALAGVGARPLFFTAALAGVGVHSHFHTKVNNVFVGALAPLILPTRFDINLSCVETNEYLRKILHS